jgi:hypothetical protein
MVDTNTTADIDAQIKCRESRLLAVVDDIRAVFREDIPVYFAKQAKALFIANPLRAEALSAQEIRAFKARIQTAGDEAAVSLDERLSDATMWQANPDGVAEVRTVVDAVLVWAEVQSVASSLNEALADMGFEGAAKVYSAPLYFVSGRYFPALAEHFWRLLAEIKSLDQAKGQAVTERIETNLSSKWDDA